MYINTEYTNFTIASSSRTSGFIKYWKVRAKWLVICLTPYPPCQHVEYREGQIIHRILKLKYRILSMNIFDIYQASKWSIEFRENVIRRWIIGFCVELNFTDKASPYRLYLGVSGGTLLYSCQFKSAGFYPCIAFLYSRQLQLICFEHVRLFYRLFTIMSWMTTGTLTREYGRNPEWRLVR